MKDLGIGGIIKDGNGNAILYTALLAAMAANAIPTIADGIYFTRINKLERDFDAGKISAEKLEWHVAGEYYLWTAAYYAALFGVIYTFGGSYKNNLKIVLGVVSAGIVLGVIQKNIEVDKAIAEKKGKSNNAK